MNEYTNNFILESLKNLRLSNQPIETPNDQKIFDRKVYGGFPEITTLKQLVRDVVNPEKKLGHADKKPGTDL